MTRKVAERLPGSLTRALPCVSMYARPQFTVPVGDSVVRETWCFGDPGKSTWSGTPGEDANESTTLEGEVYIQIGANQEELLQCSSKMIKTGPPRFGAVWKLAG